MAKDKYGYDLDYWVQVRPPAPGYDPDRCVGEIVDHVEDKWALCPPDASGANFVPRYIFTYEGQARAKLNDLHMRNEAGNLVVRPWKVRKDKSVTRFQLCTVDGIGAVKQRLHTFDTLEEAEAARTERQFRDVLNLYSIRTVIEQPKFALDDGGPRYRRKTRSERRRMVR